MTDRLIAVTSLVVAIIAIPITFWLARRSKSAPEMVWAADSATLISPDESLRATGLSLTYADTPVQRLARTRVALWNRTGDTIRGSDITPQDPLRVQMKHPDDHVFFIGSIRRSRESCQFAVNVRGSAFEVSFDFLDPGDGIVFEMIHLGQEGSVHDPSRSDVTVVGTIRGTRIEARGVGDLSLQELDRKALPLVRRLKIAHPVAKLGLSFASLLFIGAMRLT